MTESELQGMKKALVNSTACRASFLGLLRFISYFVFPAIVLCLSNSQSGLCRE